MDTVRVRLADGRATSRPVGFAMLRFDGHAAPSRVLLGEADDSLLLGVVTLEEMGLQLDPLKRPLSAMEIRIVDPALQAKEGPKTPRRSVAGSNYSKVVDPYASRRKIATRFDIS